MVNRFYFGFFIPQLWIIYKPSPGKGLAYFSVILTDIFNVPGITCIINIITLKGHKPLFYSVGKFPLGHYRLFTDCLTVDFGSWKALGFVLYS